MNSIISLFVFTVIIIHLNEEINELYASIQDLVDKTALVVNDENVVDESSSAIGPRTLLLHEIVGDC